MLIRLTQNLKLPGTTSRKAYRDFLEAAQENICVIPSDIFAELLKGQQQQDGDLLEVQI